MWNSRTKAAIGSCTRQIREARIIKWLAGSDCMTEPTSWWQAGRWWNKHKSIPTRAPPISKVDEVGEREVHQSPLSLKRDEEILPTPLLPISSHVFACILLLSLSVVFYPFPSSKQVRSRFRSSPPTSTSTSLCSRPSQPSLIHYKIKVIHFDKFAGRNIGRCSLQPCWHPQNLNDFVRIQIWMGRNEWECSKH